MPSCDHLLHTSRVARPNMLLESRPAGDPAAYTPKSGQEPTKRRPPGRPAERASALRTYLHANPQPRRARPRAWRAARPIDLRSVRHPRTRVGKFYDDAVIRYERGDAASAIIQLKNALQQDPKLLAAHAPTRQSASRERRCRGCRGHAREGTAAGRGSIRDCDPAGAGARGAGQASGGAGAVSCGSRAPGSADGVAGAARPIVPRSGGPRGGPPGLRGCPVNDPKYLPAVLALADLAALQGRRADAVALADEAMRIAPNDASVWHFRGTLALAAGDAKAAPGGVREGARDRSSPSRGKSRAGNPTDGPRPHRRCRRRHPLSRRGARDRATRPVCAGHVPGEARRRERDPRSAGCR